MNFEELKVKAEEELGADTSDLPKRNYNSFFSRKDHFFTFDNGFGAYVMEEEKAGRYDLVVIDVDKNKNWEFNFKNCITHDVLVELSPDNVYELLEEIKNL